MHLHPNNHHEQGKILLQIARRSIKRALEADARTGVKINNLKEGAVEKAAGWLSELGATFITLTQNGRLRGCIGSLQAHQSLYENVSDNAVSAALHDTRFPPLKAAELASINVEVSLLSALQPLAFASEEEALEQLRPGIDGVMLEYGVYRSTFLPQVWESLSQPRKFLAQLKVKAGLYPDFWDDAIQLSRYTVQKWRESDFSEGSNSG